MSTKTTLKRVALVAVSALGLGLTSVMPANASASTGFSLNASSITVVDLAGSNAGYGVFEVTLSDGSTAGIDDLETTESLRAEVIAPLPNSVDTTTATSDITLVWDTAANFNPVTGASSGSASAGAKTVTGSDTGRTEDLGAVAAKRGGDGTASPAYILKVGTASGKAVDKGTYTIRISLFDNATPANGNVIATQTVRFTVVSEKLTSGAVLTAAAAGLQNAGAAFGSSNLSYLSATLRDANGGLVREDANAVPSVAGTLVTTAATPLDATNGSGITGVDNGEAADFSSSATAGTEVALNGVYGFGGTAASSIATTTGTFRVRYGAATATATVSFGAAVTALAANAAPVVTATGLLATDVATPWRVPTSTKSATLTVLASSGSVLVNYPITFSVAYSNVGAGDATPVAATPTIVYTDSSGYASLTVTNNSPVHGATATVTVTGFTTALTAQVIEWVSPGRQTAITVSPASQRVASGTTTVVTATVTDRFGAPVAGVVLQPSLSTTSANYSATPMATVTTNAAGQATVSLVAGANLTSDAITFTDISGLATAGNATYSYRTTVDATASFLKYYSLDESLSSTASTPTPSSGITNADGTYLAITKARNNSRIISAGGTVTDLIGIRVQALTSASAGVVSRPITITVSEGAFIRSSTGTPVTSRTMVTSSTGFIDFIVGSNKTGANTVTLTAGSVTDTIAFWTTNAAADARYVTLTGATTGTANGDAIPFTATVTDRYGNPVSNVSLTIQATGVGVMGGGSTLQTFTTNSAGTFTFTGTSLNAAGGSATFTASAASTSEFASAAGFSGATAIDSTVTAGRNSSSVTVTFAAGQNASQVAAEAAADAAAEAIDAANAATDAANLAAEAADAATVAAEEARDAADAATAAVEELSTQVATLMAALRAQITTLANTVAKIAKKVRA